MLICEEIHERRQRPGRLAAQEEELRHVLLSHFGEDSVTSQPREAADALRIVSVRKHQLHIFEVAALRELLVLERLRKPRDTK
jgi:hypothetical protein